MMKKVAAVFGFFVLAAILGASVARAQTTEPPLGLPLYTPSESPTPTPVTADAYVTYREATPTPVPTQEYIDDAETGSELFVLAALSLVAGVGLYFIKKYFDIKKYSI